MVLGGDTWKIVKVKGGLSQKILGTPGLYLYSFVTVKMYLNKYGVMLWTGSNWLRIGFNGGVL
jgi:hypothetical protein